MTEPAPRLSDEFLAMVEALRMAPTFARGRRDYRAGHVRSLIISSSLVVAQVRGPEDPAAHRSRIAVRAFGAAEWSRVEDDLAAEARWTAELLAGRMPAGIGAVFAAAGLSLLPLAIDEIAMDCTCERWPMPCTHLAATFYALARSFDEDPFGAFAWRGRSRDELLHRLGQLRGAAAVEALPGPAMAADPAADAGLGDIADFWGFGGTPAASPVPPAGESRGGPAAVPFSTVPGAASGVRADALLDQLDPPSVPAGGRPLIDVLRPAYLALPVDP